MFDIGGKARALTEEVETLRAQVLELNRQRDTIGARADQERDRAERAEAQIATLEARAADRERAAAANADALQSEVSDLRERLDAITAERDLLLQEMAEIGATISSVLSDRDEGAGPGDQPPTSPASGPDTPDDTLTVDAFAIPPAPRAEPVAWSLNGGSNA